MKSILIIFVALFLSGCEDLNTFCPKDTNTSDSNTTNPDNNTTYYLHTNIKTSLFWIGEFGDDSESAWDSNWIANYGGIDRPDDRKDPPRYEPADFIPKENSFYVALPYNDMQNGEMKADRDSIVPWSTEKDNPYRSICKNRWVKITSNSGASAYAQWEDVGPSGDNDVKYVFEQSNPSGADSFGLAISPAVRDYLKLNENEEVNWKFAEEESVDISGPWFDIITTSNSNQ